MRNKENAKKGLATSLLAVLMAVVAFISGCTNGNKPVEVSTKPGSSVSTTNGEEPVDTTKGEEPVVTTKEKEPVVTTMGEEPVVTTTVAPVESTAVAEDIYTVEITVNYENGSSEGLVMDLDEIVTKTITKDEVLSESEFAGIVADAINESTVPANDDGTYNWQRLSGSSSDGASGVIERLTGKDGAPLYSGDMVAGNNGNGELHLRVEDGVGGHTVGTVAYDANKKETTGSVDASKKIKSVDFKTLKNGIELAVSGIKNKTNDAFARIRTKL